MMESDKDKICKQIKKTCFTYLSLKQWQQIRPKVYLNLAKLQPGTPDDGIPSFIAYNGGNDKPRVKAKTGKFLTKKMNLADKLCPGTLEALASEINLLLFGIENITILHGAEITNAYKSSFGSGSCMTGRDCEYTKLYESNPTRFGLFTMSTGNNQARAILHTLDDGSLLLDRVYGNNEVIKQAMEDHARKEGWFYHNGGDVLLDGCLANGPFISSGLTFCEGEVPYMDTLNFGDIVGGLLTITNDSGDFCLDSTCGCIEQKYTCSDCGEEMSGDEGYDTGDDYICDYCRDNNYFYCNDCEELHNNDVEYLISDLEVSVCSDCIDNYSYCNDCDCYCTSGTEIVDNQEYVCDDCLDKYTCCDDCGHYNMKTTTIDDEAKEICKDCIDSYFYCECCDCYVGELDEDNNCLDCAEKEVEV